jgi:hypothetical protein
MAEVRSYPVRTRYEPLGTPRHQAMSGDEEGAGGTRW